MNLWKVRSTSCVFFLPAVNHSAEFISGLPGKHYAAIRKEAEGINNYTEADIAQWAKIKSGLGVDVWTLGMYRAVGVGRVHLCYVLLSGFRRHRCAHLDESHLGTTIVRSGRTSTSLHGLEDSEQVFCRAFGIINLKLSFKTRTRI